MAEAFRSSSDGWATWLPARAGQSRRVIEQLARESGRGAGARHRQAWTWMPIPRSARQFQIDSIPTLLILQDRATWWIDWSAPQPKPAIGSGTAEGSGIGREVTSCLH